MSISLNFELNDDDLAHFDTALTAAKKAAEGKSADEIIDCAGKLLTDAQKVGSRTSSSSACCIWTT